MALTTHPIYRRGWRKSRAIHLLPLWAFVACSRVNFTLLYLYRAFCSWVGCGDIRSWGFGLLMPAFLWPSFSTQYIYFRVARFTVITLYISFSVVRSSFRNHPVYFLLRCLSSFRNCCCSVLQFTHVLLYVVFTFISESLVMVLSFKKQNNFLDSGSDPISRHPQPSWFSS